MQRIAAGKFVLPVWIFALKASSTSVFSRGVRKVTRIQPTVVTSTPRMSFHAPRSNTFARQPVSSQPVVSLQPSGVMRPQCCAPNAKKQATRKEITIAEISLQALIRVQNQRST